MMNVVVFYSCEKTFRSIYRIGPSGTSTSRKKHADGKRLSSLQWSRELMQRVCLELNGIIIFLFHHFAAISNLDRAYTKHSSAPGFPSPNILSIYFNVSKDCSSTIVKISHVVSFVFILRLYLFYIF